MKRVEVILGNFPYHKNSYGLGKKKPLKTLRPYFFKRYFPVKSLKRKILQITMFDAGLGLILKKP